MSLTIESSQTKNATTLTLHGDINSGESAAILRKAVRGAVAKGATTVTLDLGDTSIGRAGAETITNLYHVAQSADATIKLANAQTGEPQQVARLQTSFSHFAQQEAAAAEASSSAATEAMLAFVHSSHNPRSRDRGTAFGSFSPALAG